MQEDLLRVARDFARQTAPQMIVHTKKFFGFFYQELLLKNERFIYRYVWTTNKQHNEHYTFKLYDSVIFEKIARLDVNHVTWYLMCDFLKRKKLRELQCYLDENPNTSGNTVYSCGRASSCVLRDEERQEKQEVNIFQISISQEVKSFGGWRWLTLMSDIDSPYAFLKLWPILKSSLKIFTSRKGVDVLSFYGLWFWIYICSMNRSFTYDST